MSKNVLYTVKPPSNFERIGDLEDYYIPNTNVGVKTASYMDQGTGENKQKLFQKAAEEDVKDLSVAYRKLQETSEEYTEPEKGGTDYQPPKSAETPEEMELELATEKEISKREKAVKENGEDDLEHPNDIIFFKTWLDD